MDVYLYRGADQLSALTTDEAGASLPADLGLWTLVRLVTLHGGGPDEEEALALVQDYGFCCFS